MSTLRDVWVLPGVARRILFHLVPDPWGRVLVARLMLALTARALGPNVVRIDGFIADPIQTRYLHWH